jgi:hypothetical protein
MWCVDCAAPAASRSIQSAELWPAKITLMREQSVRGITAKQPGSVNRYKDASAGAPRAIRSQPRRWRYLTNTGSVRPSNPGRRSARERSHLGWDERRHVDGRVRVQSDAPLRRGLKRTERSAVLGSKENASHLLRTHKRSERSQRRGSWGELGPSQRAAGGWKEIARCRSCVFGRSWPPAVAASRSVKLAGSSNKDHACAREASAGRASSLTPADAVIAFEWRAPATVPAGRRKTRIDVARLCFARSLRGMSCNG